MDYFGGDCLCLGNCLCCLGWLTVGCLIRGCFECFGWFYVCELVVAVLVWLTLNWVGLIVVFRFIVFSVDYYYDDV